MIDILIPTFNRDKFLKKNILDLSEKIKKSNLNNHFRVLVSNNFSTDKTAEFLSELERKTVISLIVFHQEKNIGLESNALFLLRQAKSDYVMYLGDDDYIPEGYLEFIIDKVVNEKIGCIIPGFSALFPGNVIQPSRNASFDKRKYSPGFSTLCKLSNYGHQLSGIVTKREGLYSEYMNREECRNIYPFVFFLSYYLMREESYYAPMYQVLVSQGNCKDWKYDESGLLIDIFRNYKILFPHEPFKEALASLSFARIQSWRLRVGQKNILNSLKALKQLLSSEEVSALIKFCLPVLAFYCHTLKIIYYVKRKIHTVLLG